jgi:hypothetical protein
MTRRRLLHFGVTTSMLPFTSKASFDPCDTGSTYEPQPRFGPPRQMMVPLTVGGGSRSAPELCPPVEMFPTISVIENSQQLLHLQSPTRLAVTVEVNIRPVGSFIFPTLVNESTPNVISLLMTIGIPPSSHVVVNVTLFPLAFKSDVLQLPAFI